MKTTLYPQFSEVFANDDLQGIFYPLCSVMIGDQILHFVSHNGLWLDEKFRCEQNQSAYFSFDLVDGKYHFKGDISSEGEEEFAETFLPIEGRNCSPAEYLFADFVSSINESFPIN